MHELEVRADPEVGVRAGWRRYAVVVDEAHIAEDGVYRVAVCFGALEIIGERVAGQRDPGRHRHKQGAERQCEA